MNTALERYQVIQYQGKPVAVCRLLDEPGTAYVEVCCTQELENLLKLDGKPFEGKLLKIQPWDYGSEDEKTSESQLVTGTQSSKTAAVLVYMEQRPNMHSEDDLIDFLNKQMKYYGLSTIDKAIIFCSKTSFLHLASPTLAENLLRLNGIRFENTEIRFSRHPDYKGPKPPITNFSRHIWSMSCVSQPGRHPIWR